METFLIVLYVLLGAIGFLISALIISTIVFTIKKYGIKEFSTLAKIPLIIYNVLAYSGYLIIFIFGLEYNELIYGKAFIISSIFCAILHLLIQTYLRNKISEKEKTKQIEHKNIKPKIDYVDLRNNTNENADSIKVFQNYAPHDDKQNEKTPQCTQDLQINKTSSEQTQTDKIFYNPLYLSCLELSASLTKNCNNESLIINKITRWLNDNKELLLKQNVNLYNEFVKLSYNLNNINIKIFVDKLNILIKELNSKYSYDNNNTK